VRFSVTPVPIPNTEVKPVGADGTAREPRGRVGSRRDYLRKPARAIMFSWAFVLMALHFFLDEEVTLSFSHSLCPLGYGHVYGDYFVTPFVLDRL
jgi:hypothetical protein